ncbi:MAG: LLM class flavin-dependent oxidoreductase [Candidatus Thiodiazotropha sp. (ex Rostrolucina anterorostrata)]|nr:LLM class flavin-dependent oxidoreductase [Candidatus Thiodiazotropha sp. (ex Rostrolucina anterorostrata)]
MSVSFEIGILPNRPVSECLSLARQAEECGYGGVWVADSQCVMRDAYILLSQIALQTSHIQVAAGVTNAITRHPAVLASSWATMDEVSRGRAVLGIGVGESAIHTLGLKPDRLAALEKKIILLRALMKGQEVEYEGRSFRLTWCDSEVPIVMACSGPKSLQLGGAGIENIEQLDGSSVAGYVDFAPPAHFLNWILADVSLDRTPDIQPVRDDLARLGLLLSGEVDAGLFSSAVSPVYLETFGLNKLSSPAELLQFPITGLTTEMSVIEQQPELVEALVAAHAEALALLHKDVDFICSTIKEMPLLGDPAGLIPTLRGALTEDGHVTESVGLSSLRRMAQSMGSGSSSLGHSALFDFSALNRFLN